MNYLKINEVDVSRYVSGLKIKKNHTYKSVVNASGNTIVKRLNTKREIEVSFIQLDEEAAQVVLALANELEVNISYREPLTRSLIENIKCVNTTKSLEYYTIRDDKVTLKPFSLTFTEL